MDRLRLCSAGWDTFFEEQLVQSGYKNSFPARVISQQGSVYTVMSEEGLFNAKTTGKFRFTARRMMDYPVVGDFIVAEQVKDADSILIHKVLTRKNYFARKMPVSGGRKLKNGVIDGGLTEEQVLASNIDTVFIICGLDNNFSIPRIERYLTLTRHQNLNAAVLLNKSDLCGNPKAYVGQVNKIAFGVPVLAISASVKNGFEQLEQYMAGGKTIVFLGSSGVGKSTLLNALVNREVQATNSTSCHSGKGKHTTTHRQMFFHPSGCMIIDTPGMRELQLWAEDEDLGFVYQDVLDLISRCKFKNCTHKNEPGCAVKEALEKGRLSAERYGRYLASVKELKRLEEKKREYGQRLTKRGHVK